ncbi:zinc-binding dehydrogenase [Streptomyces sp. MMG1121]|uniref:zinc-binding dehydrogenase n=1 Tax=Streptomyces sp. MMG1121 TaxID=1415544 RepID=UPI003B63C0A0
MSRAERRLQREQLPAGVVVEDVQDALQAKPVHRLRTSGKPHIPVEKSYTLAEAAAAHIDSQAGHTRGRRVLVV